MGRIMLGRSLAMSNAAATGVLASAPRERAIVMLTVSVRVILFVGLTTAPGVMGMTAVKSYYQVSLMHCHYVCSQICYSRSCNG